MQHIVVKAAKPMGLKADDWSENGAGRKGVVIVISNVIINVLIFCMNVCIIAVIIFVM